MADETRKERLFPWQRLTTVAGDNTAGVKFAAAWAHSAGPISSASAQSAARRLKLAVMVGAAEDLAESVTEGAAFPNPEVRVLEISTRKSGAASKH